MKTKDSACINGLKFTYHKHASHHHAPQAVPSDSCTVRMYEYTDRGLQAPAIGTLTRFEGNRWQVDRSGATYNNRKGATLSLLADHRNAKKIRKSVK